MNMAEETAVRKEWSTALSAALAPLRAGRPAESVERLRALLVRLTPDEAVRGRVLEALGRALFAGGAGQAAEAALRESVDLLRRSRGAASPEALGALQNLAHLLLEQGDLAGKAQLWDKRPCGCAKRPRDPVRPGWLRPCCTFPQPVIGNGILPGPRLASRGHGIFSASSPLPIRNWGPA